MGIKAADGVHHLNVLVQQCHNKEAKRCRPKNTPHGRRLGSRKDKPLPFPGKVKPIDLSVIDEDWLDTNPENKHLYLITRYTKQELEDDADMGYDGENENGTTVDGQREWTIDLAL